MKTLAAALSVAILLPTVALAQIKTISADPISVTATVQSVDQATRMMTLRAADGTVTTIAAPAEVTRFNEIKVGDRITATFNETIILRVMKPGEPAVNSATRGVTAGAEARPSATATVQRSVTATITAIDETAPSITLRDADGKSYTTKVADREALKQVKVGDRLDVTWAAAVLVSVAPPKAA